MDQFKPKPAESFDFKYILYQKKDWVARVTINRPEVYNCLNTATLIEMMDAFRDAMYDDAVAALVLTGAGSKAFSTGGDVKEYADAFTQVPRNYWKYMQVFIACFDLLRNMGKPTIARINGIVAGGGNELNIACDLAIAAQHATLQQVGTKVGSVAAAGATQWLPIMIGDRRAREMLLTCEPISAQQALEWGLVNQVVPYEQLDDAVNALCQKLIDKFPECTRYTRTQINFWKDMAWSATIRHAQDWLSLHFATAEPYEGMKAFVEKRPVDYVGLRKKAVEGKAPEFLWGAYTQTCGNCGAKGIPSEFEYCGRCGHKLA
jgi:enoyl-CoA hydratase/carnithine racemase